MIAITARTDAHKTNSRRDSLKRLSDTDLLKQLDDLRGKERSVQFEILRYLNEVDRRRLYLPRGYSSLFEFCTGYLKYSNSSAGRRIRAARCIRRHPRVGRMFLAGELDLTVIARIARILTRENEAEVLAWIKGKPFRDVEIFVSRNRPGRLLRDIVRPVLCMTEDRGVGDTSNMKAESSSACKASFTFTPNVGSKSLQGIVNKTDENIVARSGGGDDARGFTATPADKQIHANPHASVEDKTVEHVLITEKFTLEFTVNPEFMEKLERVKSLLSTKYPKGIDFQTLFDVLLTEYLERHSPEERIKRRDTRKKSKKGLSEKIEKEPACMNHRIRSQDTKKRSRYIPQDIKDKIFERDGGRCTFVGSDGRRCNSTWNVHVDHIIPFARGGDNSPENLRLLCAKHNNLEAERAFGREKIKKCIRRE